MKSEIECIVASDEAARIMVRQAQEDADRLLSEATDKARAMRTALVKRLQEVEDQELVPIITAAHQQAQQTIKQTAQYIENLRKRLALRKTTIIDRCISSALNRNLR